MTGDSPLPIVCDATVVLNLGQRGELGHIAGKLRHARTLYVTPEIVAEVSKVDPDFYRGFISAHFEVHTAIESPLPPCPDPSIGQLDAGEVSVLMACRAHGWVAGIDEREGRKAAQFFRIPLLGTIGILEEAVAAGWMDADQALEAVSRMRQRGFHCPKVLSNDDFSEYISRLRSSNAI